MIYLTQYRHSTEMIKNNMTVRQPAEAAITSVTNKTNKKNKLVHKHQINNEKWNTHTHTRNCAQTKNSCDELTADKS